MAHKILETPSAQFLKWIQVKRVQSWEFASFQAAADEICLSDWAEVPLLRSATLRSVYLIQLRCQQTRCTQVPPQPHLVWDLLSTFIASCTADKTCWWDWATAYICHQCHQRRWHTFFSYRRTISHREYENMRYGLSTRVYPHFCTVGALYFTPPRDPTHPIQPNPPTYSTTVQSSLTCYFILPSRR